MTFEPQGTLAVDAILARGDAAPTAEASRSAVSWAAVLAGAVVMAASSLILLVLGSGFGLLAASPWPGAGASAAGFTVAAGIWIIVVQWLSAAIGGYLTGRLRVRWVDLHTHEVFFRDTAHGFLTWAAATLAIVVLAVFGAAIAGGAAAHRTDEGVGGLYASQVDVLFRSVHPDDTPSAPAARAEAGRMLTAATADDMNGAVDRAYLAELVSAHADVSPAEAQGRVDAAVESARTRADKARKAGSAAAIFTGLAMLIGALIASAAAALGGQQRDEHP